MITSNEKEKLEFETIRKKNRCIESFIDKLPKRFKEFFDNIIYKEDISKYEAGSGAFITGPVGTGKTVLSFQLAKKSFIKLCEKITGNLNGWGQAEFGYLPGFKRISSIEMIIDFQNFSEKDRPLEEKIKDYCHVDILLIDDLGTEKTTDFVAQCIYQVINTRYESKKETIITSNKALSELDDRIASRIVEMCEIIKTNGADMRIKK